ILFTGPFIAPEEPFVVLGGFTLIDENGNGIADYAENIDLQITLNNMGENPATDINANISTEDPYITLNQAFSEYDDISGGSSQINLTDFNFDVDSNCSDGHNVIFTINISSNENDWEYYFSINLNAPELEINNIAIINDDNSDGILDPGETADLVVLIANSGGAAIWNLNLMLSTDDIYITINESQVLLDSIESNSEESVIFNVSVSEEADIGHVAEFMIDIDADFEFNTQLNFEITIGMTFALEFDGDDDWIETSMTNLQNCYQITVEAWVKVDPNSNGNLSLISKYHHSQGGYLDDSFYLGLEDGIIRWQLNAGDSYSILYGNTNLANSNWYHIAAIWDGSNQAIYLNGYEENSTMYPGNGQINNTIDPVIIGRSYINGYPNWFLNGMIDEIRIWNVERTQQEIQMNMYSPLTGNEDGLVGYWKMDEGVGSLIYDCTNNGNNGTIYGATWVEGVLLNGLYPPRNLGATTEDNTVSLFWEPPFVTNELSCYNIYRNNEIINSIIAPDTTYIDQDLSFGLYTYFVTAVYGDENESGPSNEVSVCISESGCALDFDGIDDYVSIAGNSELSDELEDGFTISAWIHPANSTILGQGRIVSNDWSYNSYYLVLYQNTIRFAISNGSGGWNHMSYNYIYSADEWRFISASYNGNDGKIYVDGELKNSTYLGTTPDFVSSNIDIGAKNGGSQNFFNGLIDEVRIWNVARTQEEIKNNMNLKLNGNENGLVGYWRMDEGVGSIIYDYTNNGNEGTIHGASWIPVFLLKIPNMEIISCNFTVPVINKYLECESGIIELDFSYDSGILEYNDFSIEETQLENWVVNVTQEPGSLFFQAQSTEPLNTDTDSLLVLNFNILEEEISTIIYFNSAYFNNEHLRTLSGIINIGEVEIINFNIPQMKFSL
ncbi:MAG: hypothetical protein KAT74_12115, partial [Candidatus Cloacimonetes bacterium]|nr:hypothetical protein [Candidatus Cloacimonadota bacterium]